MSICKFVHPRLPMSSGLLFVRMAHPTGCGITSGMARWYSSEVILPGIVTTARHFCVYVCCYLLVSQCPFPNSPRSQFVVGLYTNAIRIFVLLLQVKIPQKSYK